MFFNFLKKQKEAWQKILVLRKFEFLNGQVLFEGAIIVTP